MGREDDDDENEDENPETAPPASTFVSARAVSMLSGSLPSAAVQGTGGPAQSCGQVNGPSPQNVSHCPFPHTQNGRQSGWQLKTFSLQLH